MDDPLDADALRRLVDGDLSLLPRLKATPPARLDAIAREAPLTVTADSVIGVLEARRDDR